MATGTLTYRITFIYDDDAALDGWDGEFPLDADKTWQPYTAILEAYDEQADEIEHIDSIGGIWASDDNEGREFAVDCALKHLCPDGVKSSDIEIAGF